MFITTYKISINNSYFKLSLQVFLLRNSFYNNRVIYITHLLKVDTLEKIWVIKGFLLRKGQKVYCATKSLLCYKKFLVQIWALDHF